MKLSLTRNCYPTKGFMRTKTIFKTEITDILKLKMLKWAQQFAEVIWLDSNNYPQTHSNFQAVLAVDAFTSIKTDFVNGFEKLNEYQSITKDWLFGYLTYDLKNDLERLRSSNYDGLHFPDLYFFQPKKLFFLYEDRVEARYLNFVVDEVEADWQEILNIDIEEIAAENAINEGLKIETRTSKESYFEKLEKMKSHIERGDIYEANLCQEFYAENAIINPLQTFNHLNTISKSPFAVFLKLEHLYALSASPERFLKKTGKHIISQPIKGTAKRSANPAEDAKIIVQLENDAKERSENIMITDLVRNDLSKIALKGSVNVEELCKVYTFMQVHQLISTISCEVSESISPVNIIKNTFPMGSMTGAPKVSAMKIIENLEDAKRGLYSGTIGYFDNAGNFDFNVVIRGILYNSEKKYLSFSVGGAITVNSTPQNEYDECLVKAQAVREVLSKYAP